MRRFPFNPFREPDVNAPESVCPLPHPHAPRWLNPLSGAFHCMGAATERIEMQSYIWCDNHGEVHPACPNYYNVDGDEGCNRDNWRTIYIDGERGEVF